MRRRTFLATAGASATAAAWAAGLGPIRVLGRGGETAISDGGGRLER